MCLVFTAVVIHQGIRIAIAAEMKRRGPHLAMHFKRYLTHLLTPVLEPMGLQVQVCASETVSPAHTMDGSEDKSKELDGPLRQLDHSLREVRELTLHCLTDCLTNV